MALKGNLDNETMMTADICVTEFENWAAETVVPMDEFPLAQRIEPSVQEGRPDVDPLCRALHGQIFDRRSEHWQRFGAVGSGGGKAHINCRAFFRFISKDERDAEGRPLRPTFTPPPREWIERHGHFILEPKRFEVLNTVNFVEGREFVFKRVKDAETGEFISVLIWNAPMRELVGLKPDTVQVDVSERDAIVRYLRRIGLHGLAERFLKLSRGK